MGKLLEKMGAEFVHADLTELVSSQAKVMLAGIDTLWALLQLYLALGNPTSFRSGECSRHPPSGRMGGRLGRALILFISPLPHSILITTITVISKEDFRPHRFANEFARSKAAGEEVINLLAQANPQTRFTVLRPQSLFGPHDKVFIPRLAHMMHHYGSVLLPHGGSALVDMTYYENAIHAMWLASQPGCDHLPSGPRL